MSSPSDNEKSKHTDEESLSDKESFTNEPKVTKKDRKKKRKSKELLKSPCKSAQMKASPGTSKKADSNLMAGESNSNSGEKHVGVVGDNIKHLNLNEGDKVTDSKHPDGPKTTVVQAEIGVSPGISMSQPDHIIESPLGSNNLVVQQPPANEQGSFINEPMCADELSMATSTSSLEVRGVVPNNSLNEPGDSPELKADLRLLPSTSVAYKRKNFARKADDTLDDVSEIISDFTDMPSDSSLGQISNQSERRPSQETSSDAKAEDLSESSESESKVAAAKSRDGHPSGKVSDSNENEDNGSENSDIDGQKIAENLPGKQHSKCDSENHDISDDGKVVDPCGSNGQNIKQRTHEKGNGSDKHCLEQGIGKDSTSAEKQGSDGHCALEARSEQLLEMENSDDNVGEEVGDRVEEPMDDQDSFHQDQDDLVHQDQSDNDASVSYPSLSEDPESGQNEMDDESHEDQLDNQEPVDEHDNSNEQGGLNNASGPESSSDYEHFARGQYVAFPIDSTTSDSGIENSSAIFDANYQVPENSESNEGSGLGSSGAAGLQNLQNWVERGVSGAPLPQVKEEVPGPSNINEQGGPSTTYASVISRKVLKVAIMETIADLPMECAEHFAEIQPEGSILEAMPDEQMKCDEPIKDETENLPRSQRPDTSLTNLLQDKIEPQNLNVISDSTSSSNELKAELVQRTSSGANVQEPNPDEIDDENNSLPGEETAANNNQVSSPNPKGSRQLVKGDSDDLSNSSREPSREGSFADMNDAIESSESINTRAAEPQQTATSILQTLDVPGITSGTESGSKPQRKQEKRPRKFSESNSPLKKRKETIACGQQARAAMQVLKRPEPDSDEESSKDDRKSKG